MARKFHVRYTGDYLNAEGRAIYGDIATGKYADVPYIDFGFLMDQRPMGDMAEYVDKLYSLEIQPHHVAQANGIVIFRPWVRASAFTHGAENLVVIGRAGAGNDKIDMDACTANDVAVFNAPDTLTHSTASAAFTLMLALAKRLTQQEKLARSGCWDGQAQLMGDDLPGQTLGIIGLGRSGRELARLTSPFHMRILAYSPRAEKAEADKLGVTLVDSLDEVLREADYVSLHGRLDAQTRGMIGERQLRAMKPTAYFINVARGEMVQQDILVRALSERWIAGAGLDVFEHEPLPVDDPLLALDNVIVTPHWLPSTRQAGYSTMMEMVAGILRAAQGQIPENVVNRAVLERSGFQAKLSHYAENKTNSGAG